MEIGKIITKKNRDTKRTKYIYVYTKVIKKSEKLLVKYCLGNWIGNQVDAHSVIHAHVKGAHAYFFIMFF